MFLLVCVRLGMVKALNPNAFFVVVFFYFFVIFIYISLVLTPTITSYLSLYNDHHGIIYAVLASLIRRLSISNGCFYFFSLYILFVVSVSHAPTYWPQCYCFIHRLIAFIPPNLDSFPFRILRKQCCCMKKLMQ